MTHHSLHLKLPPIPPYDDAFYLESFVGNHVRPLADRLGLFWFSRYGKPEQAEVKFRFSVEDFETIKAEIDALASRFAHGEDGCGSYDPIGDLAGDRFIAPDRRSLRAERGILAYQFLTASAKLFLHSLVPHGAGWKHEEETTTGYNRKTPLEQYHHLFCNMTNVPTWAALVQKDQAYNIVSDFQSRSISDPRVRISLFAITH